MWGIGYILLNGNFLNLKTLGFNNHYSYEQCLKKEGKLVVEDSHLRYLTNSEGWIRVNDGTNVKYEVIVELPIKPITEEQYNSLLQFLDYLYYKNRPFVNVGIEENSRGTGFTQNSIWFKHYDFKEYLPDDIIKEIRIHYNYS